jgi:short-chain fatty acids transporter
MSHTPDLVLDEEQTVRAGRPGPLHRFTDLSVRYVEKWMPDPYLFAVILTIVVVALIFAFVPDASLGGVVDGWYKGVWGEGNIFTFAMQMILILVGGYTLAEAPLVKRGLQWLASKPNNQAQGGLLCFAVAALACVVNWGLGLVVGALLARQVFARLRSVNFAYLVAAGYMGYMVWTSGLSSSIALANTEQADVDREALLALDRPHDDRDGRPAGPRTFAERLENLWILNVLVFVAGIAYFVRSGFKLNIGSMVMLFFILGALFHWTPMRFIRSFTEAAKTSGPLLLQYPLYGGIIGLLGYTPHSGVHPLQTVIASAIVSHATYYTLPFLNYLASVVISLFVPSGGGHWGVQGPVAVDAAVQLGQTSPAYLGKISMSVANGEAVANMIQPFWLLPVLAIAKLNIRRVMGFTVVAFVVGFVVLGIGSLLMPLLP